jgi:hypothetical protein
MIGLALNIVAFIVVASFIIYIGIGALGLIANIFGSSSNNESKGLLKPVIRKLGISEGGTISSDTPKEVLKEALEIYYGILTRVFESETPEQRNATLSSNSPSGKLSQALFELFGLGTSLNTLTRDIDYVMEGSGWVKYKKMLEIATNGTLKITGNNKYEILFNKSFLLKIEEYNSFDYSSDREKEWRVEGFCNHKEVLSCYTPRADNIAYTFKPDIWILDIIKSAEKYSRLTSELKLNEATERRKSELFN